MEGSGGPILGTPADSIDAAEDRNRFKKLLEKINLRQPANGIVYSLEEARVAAVRLVHGTVIQQRDSVPLTYLIRVASHPNACAVKQALARLKTLPQVAATLPHLIWVMDSLGNLHKVPGAAKGPPTPCPSGYGLLR